MTEEQEYQESDTETYDSCSLTGDFDEDVDDVAEMPSADEEDDL